MSKYIEKKYHDKVIKMLPLKIFENTKLLAERQGEMNKIFNFSKPNLKKLDAFVEFINSKTKEATIIAESLVNDMEKNPLYTDFISDFELDLTIELYSDKYIEGEEDDGCFAVIDFVSWSKREKRFIDNHSNFNEYANSNHPLSYQKHNMITHWILTDSWLAWQDIVDVNDVWIDIVPRLQNSCVFKGYAFKKNILT